MSRPDRRNRRPAQAASQVRSAQGDGWGRSVPVVATPPTALPRTATGDQSYHACPAPPYEQDDDDPPVPAPPPPVRFFVHVPSRQAVEELTTHSDASIGYIKIMMQGRHGLTYSRQCMLLDGKKLENWETLASIKLASGGLIQLVEDDSNDTIQVFVKTFTERTFAITVPTLDIPVITLKDQVFEKERIPPDQQRMIYAGKQLEGERALSDYKIGNGCTIHLVPRLRGGKPVIYLRSPTEIDASVRLSLIRDWRFSAVYPVVPTKRTSGSIHETVLWNVRTRTDGTMKETNTGLDVSYLFWEALTNSSAPMELTPPSSPTLESDTAPTETFRPIRCSFDDSDSVVLEVPKITPYLDRALKALGLDIEARTSFITYWLPDLLKHDHVALRFVPQASYSRAAPMDVNPIPDVVTRVFMVFRKVASDELGLWEGARQRAHEDVDFWRDVVGVEKRERQEDPALFRVLEWGGMEVV